MKKKYLSILVLALTSLSACNGNSSEEKEHAVGALQEYFLKLKDNNFTVSYTDYFMSFGKERTETKRYTSYSLEAEGDLGSYGIAQGTDSIFKYTVTDGDIVSGLPILANNGIRYDSVFDYTYGLEDFDISYLPAEADSKGTYTYTFGENDLNDAIFANVFLIRQIAAGIYPEKTTVRVLGDKLVIDSVILTYSGEAFGNNTYEDTVTSIVSNVSTTENAEIKKYLSDGKSAKNPLDLKFYKFIAPYLESNNYTIQSDSSLMPGTDFNVKQIFTDDAIINSTSSGDTGYVLKQGSVAEFSTVDGKVQITGVPVQDEYNTLYTSLYGGVLEYTLSQLEFNDFIGYVDEEHENSYVITDSQTVGTLSYICYCTISDTCYTDRVRLEVIDEDTHEFRLYFDLTNKETSLSLGTYVCTFAGLNATTYAPVERYLNIGEDASLQSKNTLMSVLEKYRQNNYSLEVGNSSVGLIRYCYTEDCFYEYSYMDPSNNFGYIRKGSDAIYAFDIENSSAVIDETKNYAAGDNPLKLPGTGSYLGAEDDVFYFSAYEDSSAGISNDDLYDSDNYAVASFGKYTYWENTKSGFAQSVLDYITGGTSAILPMGAGFIVSSGKDDYDTRVSLICNYIASDGSYSNSFIFTFFDIGTTSVSGLDSLLS